jgi:hypothetical protein
MRALLLARDAADAAHKAVLGAIEYEGRTYELHDADTMLQDVLSQLNGAIRAKRPERPIYIKGAA